MPCHVCVDSDYYVVFVLIGGRYGSLESQRMSCDHSVIMDKTNGITFVGLVGSCMKGCLRGAPSLRPMCALSFDEQHSSPAPRSIHGSVSFYLFLAAALR